MSQLKGQLMEIAASLWIKPGTFDELRSRDFMKMQAEYNIWLMVNMCKRRNWIYEKGDKLHCYRSTVDDVLNKNGYDLQ